MRWIVTVVVALLGVVLVELVVRRASVGTDFVERLNTPPEDGAMFVVGNSMFQTGIDMDLLGRELGSEVAFDYHNGHYSSLWYLISDLAVPQFDVEPDLVVWGFRPFYAADPAFRQNRPTDNDLFEPGDLLYQRLTTVDDPPAQTFGARTAEELSDRSALLAARDDIQERVSTYVADLGVDVLAAVRPGETEGFREEYAAGELTIADEFLREVTGGDVQRTEELVVDGVGDFVRGPQTGFGDGFIPETARRFDDEGLEQLVIIWRPVAAADGSEIPDQEEYVRDAIEWFEAQGIPYLDLFSDERISESFYASGDHYNQEGRLLITSIVADRVRALS